jgi:hypothetical protein
MIGEKENPNDMRKEVLNGFGGLSLYPSYSRISGRLTDASLL